MKHSKKIVVLFFIIIFMNEFSLASAASPARIIAGLFSNALSYILKKLWSLIFAEKKISEDPISNLNNPRSNLNFERGYRVQTIFDGSKHGVKPYSVQIGPTGELLILDSINSNMHKISFPLSRYSTIEHVAGSSKGHRGHVDGKPQESIMYNPRGFTVDDGGNIYIADTSNKAIRKINDIGVTTIAGGRWRKRGNADRTREADFSDDFDVVYVSSLCSLLVVDRGKQAIREIQLPEEDCTSHHPSHHPSITYFPLDIAVIVASAFFGYMLAMLLSKAKTAGSSKHQSVKLSGVPKKEQANKETIKSFALQTFGSLLSWFKKRKETEQPAAYCNEKNTAPLKLHTKANVLIDGHSEKSQQVKKRREHELQPRVQHNSLAAKACRERNSKYTEILLGDMYDEMD